MFYSLLQILYFDCFLKFDLYFFDYSPLSYGHFPKGENLLKYLRFVTYHLINNGYLYPNILKWPFVAAMFLLFY